VNRLEDSASPYLRQHAGDPVEWRVWGADAFADARDLGRPIFLSSGYSACHWCHVMQREIFRDPDMARYINERFVPVKVDRELRPDVDALYMDYVVATTGHGGWPMSVFLSPDLVPLLGGGYFPPSPRDDLPSFIEVARAVDEAWRDGGEQRDSVIAAALEFLREQAAPRVRAPFTDEALETSADHVLRWHDATNGGFGTTPKFPQATLIEFLTAYYRLNPDAELPAVVERTLLAMVRGGIYDQAGGGLFRYSVDAAWRTPHFEKMLYDNGLLLSALAAASVLASSDGVRDEYGHVARQTAAFLAREMSAPHGGFYAALSADTLGEEGASYVWTLAGLRAVLTGPELDLAREVLGADAGDDHAPFTLIRRGGRSSRPAEVDTLLATLLAARETRPRPDEDTKVLTSWNALAARGLMDAGRAFDDPAMSSLGVDTLLAVEQRASRGAEVLHDAADPSVADVRLIEDHALLASACLTAHEVTGDDTWLQRATGLHDVALGLFADGDVLYMVPPDTELPVRPREQSDSPTPSGAATVVDNAIRLGQLTGDAAYSDYAKEALTQFWAVADFAPEHAGRALTAAVRLRLASER
jgi:uncharacterized protein